MLLRFVTKLPPPRTLRLILVESLFMAFCWSSMASASLPPKKRPYCETFLRSTTGNMSGL